MPVSDSSDKQSQVYSVSDISDLLGISVAMTYERIRAGVIPHKRLGRRIIVPRRLFDDWLNSPDAWEPSS